MADIIRGVLLVALLAASVVYGQEPHMDTSVCIGQDPGPNDPPFPKIPPSFDTHIEANINNRNFTTDFHLWFDAPNKRVALDVTDSGVRTKRIFNFATKQYLSIDRDTNICRTSPLTAGPLYFLFGNPEGEMRNANQFMHFNDATIKYKWINTTYIRGIQCNMWRSCLFIPSLGSTMQIDWYFSVSRWMTSALLPTLPVRAHIHGKTTKNGLAPRSFEHIYEFSDFHLNSSRDHYGTPAGAYCAGETSLKPLPNPAASFHFTAEVVVPSTNIVSYIKEYYNQDMKLVRYEYVPHSPQPFGLNKISEVHDFSTGVAYITDTLRGNCTAMRIENNTFDTRMADAQHVRIRTSKEFFYFDKASYVYEGQRTVRGINTDVWIAQRNDWPRPNAAYNSTWEWYFATGKYSENLALPLQFQNPVMLAMKGSPDQFYYYNIFDYDESQPDIWTYDISNCFSYTDRKDFSFKLPGDYRQLADSNVETFKYAVLKAITKAGTIGGVQVSALRIYNIQLDYADNSDITVQFTLLDKAPILGDVSKVKPEKNLQAVATAISSAIEAGQFIVKMRSTTTGQSMTMVARANPLVQTQRIVKRSYYSQTITGTTTSTGASGGAMAGMAVAFLVVFFILGVLATYFYYRRQGGAFGPKKFSDEDITDSTS